MQSFYYAACTGHLRHSHLGQDPVHDEGLDGSDTALRVVDSDKDVFGVSVLPLFLILLQSVLVDHGAGRVGHGASICQGCVLNQWGNDTVSIQLISMWTTKSNIMTVFKEILNIQYMALSICVGHSVSVTAGCLTYLWLFNKFAFGLTTHVCTRIPANPSIQHMYHFLHVLHLHCAIPGSWLLKMCLT